MIWLRNIYMYTLFVTALPLSSWSFNFLSSSISLCCSFSLVLCVSITVFCLSIADFITVLFTTSSSFVVVTSVREVCLFDNTPFCNEVFADLERFSTLLVVLTFLLTGRLLNFPLLPGVECLLDETSSFGDWNSHSCQRSTEVR